jgi:hypothetical protein
MKKIVTLSFLLLFLSASTEFGQLLRLPVLVHHYLEHRNQNNQSLADFLDEHYTGRINHPDDRHHDHERLPFKAECHAAQLVTIAPSAFFSFSKMPYVAVESVRTDRDAQQYSNAYLNSIWQPPRFS